MDGPGALGPARGEPAGAGLGEVGMGDRYCDVCGTPDAGCSTLVSVPEFEIGLLNAADLPEDYQPDSDGYMIDLSLGGGGVRNQTH